MADRYNLYTSYTNKSINDYLSNYSSKISSTKTEAAKSLSSSFGDYNSIKNDNLQKLTTAYNNTQNKVIEKTPSASAENSVSKNYQALQADSKKLKAASYELAQSSSYENVIKQQKDNNTGKITIKEEVNRDKINAEVSNFVNAYNNTLNDFDKTNNSALANKGTYMTNITQANENTLNKIGVSINKDNSLSLDIDKLNSADIADVKNVFEGSNSYGSRIHERAAMVESMSSNSINRISKMYNGNGRYATAINTNNLINEYF